MANQCQVPDAQFPNSMRYPALIFDFDGTIADTLTEGLRIYNELAEEKHSELSTFRRGEDGKWLFLDGITGEVE